MSSLSAKIARFLYRESQTISPPEQVKKDVRLIYGFSGLLLSVLGLFFYYLTLDVSTWYEMKPQVVIEKNEWQVILDPKTEIKSDSAEWKQALRLTDKEISSQLKAGSISQALLRLVISADKIKKASDKKAYYFRLGFLIGDINIWLDGQQMVSIPNTYTGSIDLALPIYKMSQDKEMNVMISMRPRAGARNLIPLTMGVESGLVAYQTGASFMKFNHFINRSRPLALFFVYSVFSLIFFTLWISNRVQREYLHLAAYALANSLPPLLFSDAFTTGKLRDTAAYTTYLLLVLLQATLGLSLGLAFARSQSKMITRVLWSFLVLGALVILFMPFEMRSSIRQPLNQYLMPCAFILGALACFLQANWMESAESGLSQPLRVKRLKYFTGILLALGVLYFVQFQSNFDYVTKQLLFDFPALSLVLALGFFALVDYRKQSQLVKRIPISDYHRRGFLPERVQGLVVMVDLKNSESYFTYAQQTTGFETVMPTVLSHIWTAISKSQGTILKAEGDEVVAFFDAAELENPVQNALEAMDRIANQMKIYTNELRSQYDGLESHQLHFRAAAAVGEIRPVWVEGSTGRLPAWVQVGETSVFVEASRLLEIEKQVDQELASDETIGASRVLIQTAHLEKFALDKTKLYGKFLFHKRGFVGKHERFFTVGLYQPEAQTRAALRVVS